MTHEIFKTLPPILYGTAWKEESTAELVKKAVLAGFCGIDTANQKKHYREDYAGDALLELKALGIGREDLFLQSKYTYPGGQDHRMPYDPKANFAVQVRSSFQSTLQNLHTDYLDAYLLHGPSSSQGLAEADWQVWEAMEEIHKSQKARMIGVSNVGLHHLTPLCEKAKRKPQIVQNRCFAARGWDEGVREYCLKNGIIYEGFSLLTANPQVVGHPKVTLIARRLNATPEQVIFNFASQIGIVPLTGTTDEVHMKEDLKIFDFQLSSGDINVIRSLKS